MTYNGGNSNSKYYYFYQALQCPALKVWLHIYLLCWKLCGHNHRMPTCICCSLCILTYQTRTEELIVYIQHCIEESELGVTLNYVHVHAIINAIHKASKMTEIRCCTHVCLMHSLHYTLDVYCTHLFLVMYVLFGPS